MQSLGLCFSSVRLPPLDMSERKDWLKQFFSGQLHTAESFFFRNYLSKNVKVINRVLQVIKTHMACVKAN